MARRSSLRGDFKLRKLLRTIHQEVPNEVRVAMKTSADRILDTMQQNAPKASGAAAKAMTAFVSKSGLDAQIGLRGKKVTAKYFYMRFYEYGTKGYVGPKRSGGRSRSKKNKSDGANFFGKYPDIPARPAHPWLRPAMDVNREFVLAEVRASVDRTLKKASEGMRNG